MQLRKEGLWAWTGAGHQRWGWQGTSHPPGRCYSDCLGRPGDQSFLEMETQRTVQVGAEVGRGEFRYDGACGSSRMETPVWSVLKIWEESSGWETLI